MKPGCAGCRLAVIVWLCGSVLCGADAARGGLLDLFDDEPPEETQKTGRGARTGTGSAEGSAGSSRQTTTARSADVGDSRLQRLRQNQQEDLNRLRDIYDQRARNEVPKTADGKVNTESPEYRKLEADYARQRKRVQTAYQKKDSRLADFEPANQIDGVRSTGSKPKNVDADVDWTADTPEAASAKKQQWQERGHVVVDEGHKIVNKTTDEVLWKPGHGPGDSAKIADGDALGSQGGHEAATRRTGKHGEASGDGIRDQYGHTLDHEKKFVDGQQRGNIKDQSKAVAKSGDATGRSTGSGNDDLYKQANEFKNYGDEVTSGVSHLGEDPDVRQQKVEQYQKKLDGEMRQNVAEGKRQGEFTDKTRAELAESARSAETAGGDKNKAWNEAKNKSNYDGEMTTSEAIEARRKQVAESNKATMEQTGKMRQELESGKVGTPDGDVPGGRTKVDGPDVKAGSAADEAAGNLGKGSGKLGKAAKVVGEGMNAVDIFATAEEVKQDLKEGKARDAAIKVGEAVADEFTGGAYSTGKMAIERGGDKLEADRKIDEANRRNEEAYDAQAYVKLREQGVSRDEVKAIMRAKARGDEGPLNEKFEELGVEPPKRIKEAYIGGDDTWTERAQQVGEGMVDRGEKAAKFLNEARQDLTEIGIGLTEKGVASEVVNQSKENAKGWWETYWTNRKADQDIEDARESMIQDLIDRGATPQGAEKAADAFYNEHDKRPLEKLGQILDHREKLKAAREGKDDLKEAEAENGKAGEAVVDASNGLDEYGKRVDAESGQKTEDGLKGMENQQEFESAEAAGDEALKQAELTREAGAADAQQIVEDAQQDSAEADRENSWGNVLANAAEQAVTAGGQAFGTALGAAAAQEATKEMFERDKGKARKSEAKESGDEPSDESAEESGDRDAKKKSSKGGGGDKGKSGGGDESSSEDDDGSDSEGDEESCSGDEECEDAKIAREFKNRNKGGGGGGSSGGGSKQYDDGEAEPVVYDTISCPECGYSMKFKQGTQPPRNCPRCSCGPDNVKVECSSCDYTYVGPASRAPSVCPRCPPVDTSKE
jgi:hypothetical protein